MPPPDSVGWGGNEDITQVLLALGLIWTMISNLRLELYWGIAHPPALLPSSSQVREGRSMRFWNTITGKFPLIARHSCFQRLPRTAL